MSMRQMCGKCYQSAQYLGDKKNGNISTESGVMFVDNTSMDNKKNKQVGGNGNSSCESEKGEVVLPNSLSKKPLPKEIANPNMIPKRKLFETESRNRYFMYNNTSGNSGLPIPANGTHLLPWGSLPPVVTYHHPTSFDSTRKRAKLQHEFCCPEFTHWFQHQKRNGRPPHNPYCIKRQKVDM